MSQDHSVMARMAIICIPPGRAMTASIAEGALNPFGIPNTHNASTE